MAEHRSFRVCQGVFVSWDDSGPRICHVDRPLDIFAISDDLVRVIVQLRAGKPATEAFDELGLPVEQYDAVWRALDMLVAAGMLTEGDGESADMPVLRDPEHEAARRVYAYPDIERLEPSFVDMYRDLSRSTLTSVPLAYALYVAVRHIARSNLAGAIVECGVWRGGSMALAARTLLDADDTERELWLYDTFDWHWDDLSECDGFTLLGRLKDAGIGAVERHGHLQVGTTVDDVREVLEETGYPTRLVKMIPGFVQDTIPDMAPDRIALLRLDTDLYESTLHELKHLYPRLVPGGVLIVDDYGKLEGATRAVDEYFDGVRESPLLHRIDVQGRVGVKPARLGVTEVGA